MAHKILIVEDDTDDQVIFIEAILQIDPFYECAAVGNGAEAMDYLSHTNTLPSLILLDLNMPLMNGYELLKLLKISPQLKSIPVVIFSTSDSAVDKQRTKRMGARHFFTKSADPDTLKNHLTKVLFEKDPQLKKV
jgi:CheY-like chemotaxis protein